MNPDIIAFGEILWDCFPDERKPGGAPANFIKHVSNWSTQTRLISSVGNDADGNELLDKFGAYGLPMDSVQVSDNYETGRSFIELDKDGQPSYSIQQDVAWDHIQKKPEMINWFENADIVYFGTLAQRNDDSRTTLEQLLKHTNDNTIKLCDINLRPPDISVGAINASLDHCNTLKLNREELKQLREILALQQSDQDGLLELQERFEIKTIAYTRGPDGCLLIHENKSSDCPGFPVDVADSVGAGDIFAAALSIGLAQNRPLHEINTSANQIASFVCTQSGAMPEIPQNLIDLLKPVQ